MNKPTLCLLVLTCALFAGCKKTTRSISHCGYPQQSSYRGDGTRDDASDLVFEYRGELSEFDVLGIPRGEITSEADIRRALEKSKRVNPRPLLDEVLRTRSRSNG